MGTWFGTQDYDSVADDLYDLRIEAQHQRRYQRQLAEHQHPNDPENPDTDEGEDDEDQDK
jgi:hypothetical protein